LHENPCGIHAVNLHAKGMGYPTGAAVESRKTGFVEAFLFKE
jgi:hypothetical protein